ncbi:hypothetical protein ABIE45_000273 [Methylobacterium sp. OAE515]|uniref:hypothetical protein n=1 Tax=Methylobacterium sp. OAE515 TaxID=2817895 RepID=UPI001789BA5F
MINPNYNLISEDFRDIQWNASSDITHVLRMMLFRAANESDRRYYLYAGEKAKEYRRISYELDEVARDIEHYLDDNRRVKPKHMAMIFEALILARHLILLDRRETRVQYEALMGNLFQTQEDGWSYDLAA